MMKINQIKSHCVTAVRSIAGKDVTDRLMLARNFRYYKKHKIIFIHVPKNAGSAVSKSLYGRSLGHWPAAKLRDYDPQVFDDLESFAVLRDPVDRAISAWKYCLSGGTADGWVKDRPEYHIPQFQTFERFTLEWLPEYAPKSPDFVFQSQSSFLCEADGSVLVQRLVSIETLKQDWAEIVRDKHVVTPQLRDRNRNHSPQGAAQIIPSPAAISALREIYADDFTLFEKATIA